MKKLVTVALALAVVLAIVVPAMARSAHATAPAARFTAHGTVQNVIRSAGALRMRVDAGSQAVRPFIGARSPCASATGRASSSSPMAIARLVKLADIRPGDPLAVSGRVDRSQPRSPVFVAQTIRIIDRTPTNELTVFGCGGPVTAIDLIGTPTMLTLTLNSSTRALWDRLGTSLSVVVTPTTEIGLKSGTDRDAHHAVAGGRRPEGLGARHDRPEPGHAGLHRHADHGPGARRPDPRPLAGHLTLRRKAGSAGGAR